MRKRRKKGREKSPTSLNTYFCVNYNKPKKAGISMVRIRKLRLQCNRRQGGGLVLVPSDLKALVLVPLL